MIELRDDALVFRFPEVCESASLSIDFQQTLRIPDDRKEYPLPAGLGRFPLRHVDDFAGRVSPGWVEQGGVMLPMYQSEAMWLNFRAGFAAEYDAAYFFAVKVAAGKINAVTGQPWRDRLNQNPQDYLVVPKQPWLDGFCVAEGMIRQFVAMPLGEGYTAEEQLAGKAEWGGIQIMVVPMKREVFEARARKRAEWARSRCVVRESSPAYEMGLAPGGRMRQKIYKDRNSLADWDLEHGSRCFVHIVNSLVWRKITGQPPPSKPPTAAEYARAGIPWYEWYDDDQPALPGMDALAGLKSVATLKVEKGDEALPENESIPVDRVIKLTPQTPSREPSKYKM
ncbi:MAG: hypothetical protein HY343_04450 [Lentisphaerae bacterium]|nr:hypothetical protein [Lentisphaerota bacterium]